MNLLTGRLVLQPIDQEECEAIAATVPGVRWWAPGYPTAGDVLLARLGRLTGEGWGPWQVVEAASGLAIGGAGFKGPPEDGGVEIGYGICHGWRRRGFATEAVGALMEFADSAGVRIVRAETDVGNVASQRVLQAAGFQVSSPAASQASHLLAWERRL